MGSIVAVERYCVQSNLPLPTYHLLEKSGPENQQIFKIHVKVGTISCSDSGLNNKSAKRAAAFNLLSKLKNMGDLAKSFAGSVTYGQFSHSSVQKLEAHFIKNRYFLPHFVHWAQKLFAP